ncbi:MAG: hypothetical protein JSR93_11450 [Verrucomicrobia bacterium]|nr:hypothetical protein [Verrucomicrobiota bacterium]
MSFGNGIQQARKQYKKLKDFYSSKIFHNFETALAFKRTTSPSDASSKTRFFKVLKIQKMLRRAAGAFKNFDHHPAIFP